MNNPFKYTLDNKRYHTFNYHLKTKYKHKVSKVIIDADFTCPNRDGTKGFGGCIFCSLRGSGDSSVPFNNDILAQYEANRKVIENKWPNAYAIPYFQSFTNTYGPLDKIKKYIDIFKDRDEVVEISLGTRADCLEDNVIEYLDDFSKYKEVWLEIGLQTSNDKTSEFINRGHDFKTFKDALKRLEKTNIKICIHIINGLPYETIDDMLKTIDDIKDLRYDAIKIHMLHVVKNTKLANIYYEKPFKILSKEEYIDIVIKQLERIKPEVIIERLTGDPIKEDLIAPTWVLNKTQLLNDIDKEMVKRDTYQGKYYEN